MSVSDTEMTDHTMGNTGPQELLNIKPGHSLPEHRGGSMRDGSRGH